MEELSQESTEDEVSVDELWKQLQINEEIIVVIDRYDEARLRKKLSNKKAKQNAKFKDANLPPEDTVLDFEEIEKSEIEKSQMCLRISLKKPESIKVYKLIIPEGF